MATEYSKKTNAELVEILKSRSLPHTGKKADMVARLQEADKANSGAVDAPATAAPTGTSGKVEVADDVIDWDDDAAVANPTTGAEPQVDIDPSATQDLTASKPAEGKKDEGSTEQQNGAAEEKPAEGTGGGEATSTPAVDYSIGLASTDYDAEIAKRKARAEKFGITEETASEEAQKAAERAKRFGVSADQQRGGIKGLDQALSSERPRKRGRGDDGDSHGRGGKRRDFSGRGRRRFGGGRRQPRNNGADAQEKPSLSAEDKAAMEKRRQRFG